MARITAYASAGWPRNNGHRAGTATRALKKAGLGIADIDLVEPNELLLPPPLQPKELGFDTSIVNVNGGAIALGHPIGTAARYLCLAP